MNKIFKHRLIKNPNSSGSEGVAESVGSYELTNFCNFCGEKKELRPLGKALGCISCYLNNVYPPNYKTLKAHPEDFGQVKTMTLKTYWESTLLTGRGRLIGCGG